MRFAIAGKNEVSMAAVLVNTLLFIIQILWFIIIASAIFSWLYAFNVVNPRNQFVNQIGTALYRITEPLYRPIRRFMPNLGGIDLSPLVVIVILFFVEQLIVQLARQYLL